MHLLYRLYRRSDQESRVPRQNPDGHFALYLLCPQLSPASSLFSTMFVHYRTETGGCGEDLLVTFASDWHKVFPLIP